MIDAIQISDGTPAFGDERLVCDVHVEHVESVIDGFGLQHFNREAPDVLGGAHQTSMSMVLRLLKDLIRKEEDDESVLTSLLNDPIA